MNKIRWIILRSTVWLSNLFPCATTTRLRQDATSRCMRSMWD